jgi:hypothetical protein
MDCYNCLSLHGLLGIMILLRGPKLGMEKEIQYIYKVIYLMFT